MLYFLNIHQKLTQSSSHFIQIISALLTLNSSMVGENQFDFQGTTLPRNSLCFSLSEFWILLKAWWNIIVTYETSPKNRILLLFPENCTSQTQKAPQYLISVNSFMNTHYLNSYSKINTCSELRNPSITCYSNLIFLSILEQKPE